MMNNPAVVVVAYNRSESLLRLLNSLANSHYGPEDVDLVISLDGGASTEVIDISESFEWRFGKKRIIKRAQNLGLREHILDCGRLTEEYDAVIVLEDDLMVGPYYYIYATSALSHCADETDLAGISLFSYYIKEFKHLPFMPLEDGYDNYYLQIPSSWGQVWTRKWWLGFENWLHRSEKKSVRVPTPVKSWGNDQSWKMDFIHYLVEEQLYFFYPRVSHTTNFGEVGVHQKGKFARYQVPLQMGKRDFKFSTIDQCKAIYDVFFEWTGKGVQKKYENLEFDLYGEKPDYALETDYVLTTRPVAQAVETFASTMLPLEANFLYKIKGTGINLAKKKDVDLRKRPMEPSLHERLVGKYSKQRYWYQYLYVLKETWGF